MGQRKKAAHITTLQCNCNPKRGKRDRSQFHCLPWKGQCNGSERVFPLLAQEFWQRSEGWEEASFPLKLLAPDEQPHKQGEQGNQNKPFLQLGEEDEPYKVEKESPCVQTACQSLIRNKSQNGKDPFVWRRHYYCFSIFISGTDKAREWDIEI